VLAEFKFMDMIQEENPGGGERRSSSVSNSADYGIEK
jgi:hypothetical protein